LTASGHIHSYEKRREVFHRKRSGRISRDAFRFFIFLQSLAFGFPMVFDTVKKGRKT
jgi:hypothetical protein